LDRIDLVVKVGRVETMILDAVIGEPSARVRARVVEALDFGSQVEGVVDPQARRMIVAALEAGLVTARGATRLRRLARTIANLAASDWITEEHVAEAMAFRVEW
jgi:magnesium chelatase family protein